MVTLNWDIGGHTHWNKGFGEWEVPLEWELGGSH